MVVVDAQLGGLAVMEPVRLLRQSDPDVRLVVCVQDPAAVPAFGPDLGIELMAADNIDALTAKLLETEA